MLLGGTVPGSQFGGHLQEGPILGMGNQISLQHLQGFGPITQLLQGQDLTPQGRGGRSGAPDLAEQVQGLPGALGVQVAPGQEIGVIPVVRVFLVGFLGQGQSPGGIALESFLGLLEIIMGRIIKVRLLGPKLPKKQAQKTHNADQPQFAHLGLVIIDKPGMRPGNPTWFAQGQEDHLSQDPDGKGREEGVGSNEPGRGPPLG